MEATAMESFYNGKQTESQSSFMPKTKTYRADVPAHLRQDGMYHSNSEKNLGFLKTSTGTLINFVPVNESEENLQGLNVQKRPVQFGQPPIPAYNDNHLKIKLHNPQSQLRRNASTLNNSFG